jgi:hypothetical protein
LHFRATCWVLGSSSSGRRVWCIPLSAANTLILGNHCLAVALRERVYRLDYSSLLHHFSLLQHLDQLARAAAARRTSPTSCSLLPVLEQLLLLDACAPVLASLGPPRGRDTFMQQGPGDSEDIHVRGGGLSKNAGRRRSVQARKAARAAEESARFHRLQQARVAADEAQAARALAAQLARAARAEEAQQDNYLIRAAVADAELAWEESHLQHDAESHLESEAAVLSRRLAAASARAASEENLRLDLEAREAALRAELQARQEELDALQSLPEGPHVPAPAPAPPAEAAVASPVAVPPDCARASANCPLRKHA